MGTRARRRASTTSATARRAYLGIDIGGTKILAVVLDDAGRVLGRGKKKVRKRSPEGVLERAAEATVSALDAAGMADEDLYSVGIAVPSAVHEGVAVLAPQLGWRQVPAARLGEATFGRPCYVGNDVNLGLAAEYLHLAEGRRRDVVGFFVGSGLGGAIVQRGRLVQGASGLAGELGHMVVHAEGRACGCGNRGCLEAYASKTAFLAEIKRQLFAQGEDSVLRDVIAPDTAVIRSSQLKAAYDAGDWVTHAVIEEGMRYLGLGIANVMNALDPEVVVLGGGVIEAFGDELMERVRGHARTWLFGDKSRADRIVVSVLGDDAVPAGAGWLAKGKGELL